LEMIIDSHEHVILPAEKQLMLMKDAGVDLTILFSTTPHPERADSLEAYESELGVLNKILSGECSLEERLQTIKKTTRELCDTIEKYPDKFWGFGAVPLGLSYEATEAWIAENIISHGLMGIGEVSVGTGHVKLLNPILHALMNLGKMPVWIHTFYPLNLSDIVEIAELAQKFPDIPIIMGHMGGTNWLETIKLAKTHENMYLDLSASFTTIAPMLAIKELPDRTLFSSDAPYGTPLIAKNIVEWVSPDSKIAAKVLGENMMRLLND
jgi:uncharacterized protein